jgi:tetratricopeptide (TPR) repeat protein
MEAFEKYARAVEIKPDKHAAFYNWGNALDNLALTKTGIEADELWMQAIEKFTRVIEIKPDKHEALNNWGNVLLNQARTKTGLQRRELLEQACEIFMKHHVFQPNDTYNLACVEALLGHETECQKWLKHYVTHESMPEYELLTTDTDLDSVRGTAWFQDLLLSAGCFTQTK